MIDYLKVFNLTKNLTVLFIEDDINFQQETCEIFKDIFFHIDLAVDAEIGLEKYLSYYQREEKYYDIVITDINLPKMNGIELIKLIYKKNENQPIIVLSSYDEHDYLLELVNIGIEQFLIKPFDCKKILEVLFNVSSKISKLNLQNNTSDIKVIKLNGNFLWKKEDSLLFHNGKNIKLTEKETFLMQIFIKNKFNISTTQEISNLLWNNKSDLKTKNDLKPIISRFRKKVYPTTIESVYGLGYRMIF